jgi:hypothetical protein
VAKGCTVEVETHLNVSLQTICVSDALSFKGVGGPGEGFSVSTYTAKSIEELASTSEKGGVSAGSHITPSVK